jgi:adenylyl-sulfate kinase
MLDRENQEKVTGLGTKGRRILGQKGATIWLTGLSASGKSTVAHAVEAQLVASGHIACVLDGDELRLGLNRDLGFAAADRAENVRRTAEVARLFSGCGILTLVSLISPYLSGRRAARELHAAHGLPFVEIYLNTPLSACEQRDPKGLYRRARSGELAAFTGVSDPYEAPSDPDLRLDTSLLSLAESGERVLTFLRQAGLLRDVSVGN